MCDKGDGQRIDKCMKSIISILNTDSKMQTLACCCGHGRYPMTIVAKIRGSNVEIFSGKTIPREKKFYKRDPQGFYHIPETIETREVFK